ncbi:hypothetical protein BH09BAC1_BH09BAC1_12400 [soil metagenome]
MVIDIIFLISLALGFFIGFRGGIIRSLFAFVGLFMGTAVAVKCTGLACKFLYENYDHQQAWLPLAVFISLFIIVVLLVKILAMLLEKVLQASALGMLNQVSGALVWSILMVFFLSLGLWFADEGGLIKMEAKADSATFEYLRPVAPWAIEGIGNLIPWFKDVFQYLDELVDDVVNEAS